MRISLASALSPASPSGRSSLAPRGRLAFFTTIRLARRRLARPGQTRPGLMRSCVAAGRRAVPPPFFVALVFPL